MTDSHKCDLASKDSKIHHSLVQSGTNSLESITMKKRISTLVLATVTLGAIAQEPMVGGNAMFPMKNIVQNALNSKVHTTLVAAVKAAGLVDALMGKGPYTVFAPTNDAFENLPAGTVDSLLMAENKPLLTKVLTYHVVAGRYTSADLRRMIAKGKGSASLKTLQGESLWLTMNGPSNIVVKDAMGMWANISTYDVLQSNGVIHVIDSVLMPK